MVQRGIWFRFGPGSERDCRKDRSSPHSHSFSLKAEGGTYMTSLTPQELEGRINAHRELMIEMLSAMIGGEVTITTFLKKLRDDATFKDNEEDPGVMPESAFAIENASAREIRAILEAARARAAAS
jgi:hypothetical protein